MAFCYIDGQFMDIKDARLPVTDLALQRGVAVFDSIRSYAGRPFAMAPHLERLFESARLSGIACAFSEEEIGGIVREGLFRMPGDGLAKVFLTGGDVEEFGSFPRPRLLVLFSEVAPPPEEFFTKGAALSILPEERSLHRVKSINYMIPCINHAPGTFEPLYCGGGEITESATSSFFAVAGNNLITAPGHRVLRGITREIVIDLARRDGFNVEFRCLPLSELTHLDEAFITGSVKEITPVTMVGETMIGDGVPGPVTRRIYELFRENIPLYL